MACSRPISLPQRVQRGERSSLGEPDGKKIKNNSRGKAQSVTPQPPELTPGEPPVPIFTPFLPISGSCSPGCSLDGALGLLVPELSPQRLGWDGKGGGPALPRIPRMNLGSSQAQKQLEGHLHHSVKSLCVLGSLRSDNILQALASLPYPRSPSIH